MRKQSPRRGPEGAWKPGREVRGQGTPGTLRALPRNAPSFSFETLAGGGAAPRLHPRQTCAPGAGPTSCSLIYGGPWGQTGLGRLAERTPAPRMPGRARSTKAAWSPQKCHCQRRASGRPLTATRPRDAGPQGAQGAWAAGRTLPSAGVRDPHCPPAPRGSPGPGPALSVRASAPCGGSGFFRHHERRPPGPAVLNAFKMHRHRGSWTIGLLRRQSLAPELVASACVSEPEAPSP